MGCVSNLSNIRILIPEGIKEHWQERIQLGGEFIRWKSAYKLQKKDNSGSTNKLSDIFMRRYRYDAEISDTVGTKTSFNCGDPA